jgi:hypothetical protein
MSNENFMRRYMMKAGPMNSKGFEIGNMESVTQTALHISFSVEKSDAETSNTAKVQIWNLSDTNLKLLESKDCIIELKAGYGENTPLILVGAVTSAITTKDNADRMTELEVVDGRIELRDTNLSVSYNGAINCKDIYNYIADKMGVAVVFADDLAFKNLSNGFSFVGKARTALQKVAQCCGHSWSIQNGVLQITNPGKPVSSRGYLLSSDTGLVDIPKRITIGSDSDSNGSQTGWEVQYFLNGAIGVNDAVELRSKTINGYFRVYKVTMDGDNLEGDWMCTAQLLEVKP